MTARKIRFVIPEDYWGRLASIAERRHVDIPTVINSALAREIREDARVRRQPDPLAPKSNLDVLHDELNAARADGYRAPSSRRGRVA